jgi:sphingomyelin phosphodiesterase 2
MTEPIRVLTLNCWGLKYLAKYRNERLSQIGTEIASQNPPPAIVALQECWTQQDYNAIRERTQHILPHGKFYFSGIFGGGLAILSKWPIEESKMVRYALNGRPTAFFRGDWFVGKGVACAKIRIGDGRERDRVVAVFSTHVCIPSYKVYSWHILIYVHHSCTRLTKPNQMTPISAIERRKHGKLLV